MLTVKEDAVLNPVTEETAQQKRTKAVRSRRTVLVDIHMVAIYIQRIVCFWKVHCESNLQQYSTCVALHGWLLT